MPGEETKFASFIELTELCTAAEKVITDAKKVGNLPRIRIIVGQRCPVSAGPLPKVLIDSKWLPLVQDLGAAIEDCPADGAILGSEEDVEDEGLSHLDTEGIPSEDEDAPVTINSTAKIAGKISGETEEVTVQIFNQERG